MPYKYCVNANYTVYDREDKPVVKREVIVQEPREADTLEEVVNYLKWLAAFYFESNPEIDSIWWESRHELTTEDVVQLSCQLHEQGLCSNVPTKEDVL